MNHYARMALEHTKRHRPTFFASLTDPIAHFSILGEEIQGQVTRLRDELLGPPRPDESLEEYRLRGYQALREAEEIVLTEAVWQPGEETTTPTADDEETLAYRAQLATISKALAEADSLWTDEPPPTDT